MSSMLSITLSQFHFSFLDIDFFLLPFFIFYEILIFLVRWANFELDLHFVHIFLNKASWNPFFGFYQILVFLVHWPILGLIWLLYILLSIKGCGTHFLIKKEITHQHKWLEVHFRSHNLTTSLGFLLLTLSFTTTIFYILSSY